MLEKHSGHVSRYLKDEPICQRFPEKHLPCVLTVGTEVAFRSCSVIVRKGEKAASIYIVTEGQLESCILPPPGRGEDKIVHRVMERGDIFGLIAVLSGQTYTTDLVALTDAWVLVVPRETLLLELQSHPEAAEELLQQLGDFADENKQWLLPYL